MARDRFVWVIGKRACRRYPAPAMSRAIFLFNHDAAHQVAHLAQIARQTAVHYPALETVIAYSIPALRNQVERLVGDAAAQRMRWVELGLGPVEGAIARAFDRLLPASRLLRLRQNAGLFASGDVVVSSERTFLRIKRQLGEGKAPLMVKIPHGAGDRAITFHQDNTSFDLLLVSGQKFKTEFIDAGVSPERIAIVGYPKFEAIDLSARPRLFADDRPIFVYNPHFDPHLSSWYDVGPDLLRWFATGEGRAFNCIFAPHVMLFRKRWHVSPEHRRVRACPPVPPEAAAASNILVDLGSPRSFDMSYTLGADAYIGDASSQVYEFLVRPRPAFFLDTNGAVRSERAEPPRFHKAGPVAGSVPELTALLPDFRSIGAGFAATQQELVDYTFDMTEERPSLRAARAIAELLDRKGLAAGS